MTLTKNGEIIELSNESHIAAFISNGWKKAAPKEKAKQPTRTDKKPKTKTL